MVTCKSSVGVFIVQSLMVVYEEAIVEVCFIENDKKHKSISLTLLHLPGLVIL